MRPSTTLRPDSFTEQQSLCFHKNTAGCTESKDVQKESQLIIALGLFQVDSWMRMHELENVVTTQSPAHYFELHLLRMWLI